ncbi:MAG: hypothetical protein ABGW77_00185 [Campylobacterales bacterium]
MGKNLFGKVAVAVGIGAVFGFGAPQSPTQNPFCLLSQLFTLCHQIGVQKGLTNQQQCLQLEGAIEQNLRQVVEKSSLPEPQRQQVEKLLISTCLAGCLNKQEVKARFQQLCKNPPQPIQPRQ